MGRRARDLPHRTDPFTLLRNAQTIKSPDRGGRAVRVGISSAYAECAVAEHGPGLNRCCDIGRRPKPERSPGWTGCREHETTIRKVGDARKLRRQDDAEDGAAASGTALRRGSVQISVGTERQRRRRIRTVGAVEQKQRGKRSISGNAKDRSRPNTRRAVVGVAGKTRGSVKPAVMAEDQSKGGLFPVRAVEIKKGGQVSAGGQFEHGAKT